jgi:hypothetical protein
MTLKNKCQICKNCKTCNHSNKKYGKYGKHGKQQQLKKALVIGINYVGSECQLSGCINDANQMKEYLMTQCGFLESDIIMLSDHIGAKTNQLPTKANIIRNIHWLTGDLPKNDPCQLVFHYSGHGSNTRDFNNDEADRRDETICPVDYASHGDVKDDELKIMLVDSLPSNAKLFCLMDCCHSGTGLDLKYDCRVYGRKRKREFRMAENGKSTQSDAEVVLFSGCKDAQYSADAYIKGKYQGAMTWGFFEVLKKNNYQPMTYKDLLSQIQRLLSKKRYEQVPQLSAGQFMNLNQTFSLID